MHRPIASACFRFVSPSLRPIATPSLPRSISSPPKRTPQSSSATFTFLPNATNLNEFQKRHSTTQVIRAPPDFPLDEALVEESIITMESAPTTGEEILQVTPMKYVEFNCTICHARVAQSFNKPSNEKGVVIIRCPGCQNLHLIADNFGFGSSERSVDEIAFDRGESSRWECMDCKK